MRKQEKTVIIVAFCDLISIAIKFFLASFTGSLALLADAWHSMGDFATSVLVLISLLMDRRESERSQDNSEKRVFIRRAGWELRISIFIGFILTAVALGVLSKAIYGNVVDNLRRPGMAAVIVAILMVISYLRFKFESSVGRETNSPSLTADAYHSRVDIYILSLVLISLLGDLVQLPLDRWIAVVIGIMILSIAGKIIYRSGKMILQASSEMKPEVRSIEDTVVVLMLGGISNQKRRFMEIAYSIFDLHDEQSKRKWFTRLVWGVVTSCLLAYLATGFYWIGSSEVGVIERFGIPVNLSEMKQPGIHYYYPAPIGKIRKVDTHSIQRMLLGYQSTERKDLILWTNVHYIREFSIMTGDNAFMDIAANMHYRISNPALYLYETNKPEEILETIANRVIRESAGRREFFDLVTSFRQDLEDITTKNTQSLADKLNLGIEVVHIYFRDLHPPMDVAPSFEDVVSAQEDRETFVEEAKGFQKELIPMAHGQASVMTNEAQAERAKATLTATGKASAFEAMEYSMQKHRVINKFRLKIEALEAMLSGVNKFVIDRKSTKNAVNLFLGNNGTIPGIPIEPAINTATEGD